MKNRLSFTLLCCCLSLSQNSLAQHYKSSVIAETVSASPNSDSTNSFITSKLNSTTLLFYSTLNNSPGIYALNSTTSNVTKIIDSERADLLEYIHFTKGDNTVMVDLLGQLYVTDGTVAGTAYLGDFGFEDLGNATSSPASKLFRTKVYKNGFYYFYATPRFAEDSTPEDPRLANGLSKLWRSDGTVAGTNEVVSDTPFTIDKLLPSPNNNAVVSYAYSEGIGWGFWEIDTQQNSANLVANFDTSDQVMSLPIAAHAEPIRLGLLFCRSDDSAGGTSLWRLSRSNTLTRLSEGCGNELHTVGEFVYFFNGLSTLWRSDGTVSNTRARLDFYPELESGTELSRAHVCQANNQIFVTFWRNNQSFDDLGAHLWRTDGTQTDRLAVNPKSERNAVACLDRTVTIAQTNRDSLSFYRATDNTIVHSYGLQGAYPQAGPAILGVTPDNFIWEFGDDILLFDEARVVAFKYKPFDFTGYLPAIFNILEE